MKIYHYGQIDEIFGLICKGEEGEEKGVYRKRSMLDFVQVIAERCLTDRQRYIYLEHHVSGKSPAMIAKQEEISLSAVYKTLRTADRKIMNMKDIFLVADDKKTTCVLFQQSLSHVSFTTKQIMEDYYVGTMGINEIAEKHHRTVSEVMGYLKSGRGRVKWYGITKSDLKCVRTYFKNNKFAASGGQKKGGDDLEENKGDTEQAL